MIDEIISRVIDLQRQLLPRVHIWLLQNLVLRGKCLQQLFWPPIIDLLLL